MPKCVLFVDDEPLILEALRRMLRPLRDQLTCEFTDSAASALEVVSRTHVDVIVTDMQMPGMDGAALLEDVRARSPHVIRMVLTGQAERETMLRAMGAAHQLITKPCQPAALRARIMDALQLRDLITREDLGNLIARAQAKAELSDTYLDLVGELSMPEPSLTCVAAIVERDAAFAAKILQVSNSVYFGAPARIVGITQAVQSLGLETMRALIPSVHAFSSFDEGPLADSEPGLWRHSLAVGQLSTAIARHEQLGPTLQTEALTAGLLHDVGKLVLARARPHEYAEVRRAAQEEQRPLCDVEREVLGAGHADMGAYLLAIWGLPMTIVEAVRHHHEPLDGRCHTLGLRHIVKIANLADRAIHGGPLGLAWARRALPAGSIFEARWPEWRAVCESRAV